jgi:hypothetical protein
MYKPIFCIAVAVSLVGCHPEENSEQLKMVNQNLERSNSSVLNDNKIRIAVWENRRKDPQTRYLADRWLPRVNKIHQYADSIRMMIEGIKSELIAQSDSLKMDFVPVVRQLHNEDGVGIRLFEKTAEFKDSIPVLVNPIGRTNSDYMPKDIPLLYGYSDSLSEKLQFGKNWLEKSFGRSSSLMAMIMLNKIENDVLTTEKTLFEYCESTFCVMPIIYDDNYKALTVLSSSYVKQGQPIEITAGIGGFTDAMKPRITINDKEMKLDNGAVVHQFVAEGKPGKHSVMVKIEFYKPDGVREWITKTLYYTIADEK